MNLRTETETSGEDPDLRRICQARRIPATTRQRCGAASKAGSRPCCGEARNLPVTSVEVPAANGMSNETVLFDATWIEDGIRAEHRLVARIAPRDSAVPIFPSYNLDQQFRVMSAVAAHTSVPVPRVYWSESNPDALGGEFFVMERREGEIPPGRHAVHVRLVALGSFGRRLLSTPAVIGPGARRATRYGRSAPRTPPSCAAMVAEPTGAEALRAHLDDQRRYYEWATADGPGSPLIERGFDWIEANFPADAGSAVLCWGDSRIGNVIYRDFEPAAVLDWGDGHTGARVSWTSAG